MGMSYQSPIDLIISDMNYRIDGEIFKAVQNVGVNVDRDELTKALRYDRDQYRKGYNDRDAEIVRCKDCKNAEVLKWLDNAIICKKHSYTGVRPDEFYCADGERKEGR